MLMIFCCHEDADNDSSDDGMDDDDDDIDDNVDEDDDFGKSDGLWIGHYA